MRYCNKCLVVHGPPTGRNCHRPRQEVRHVIPSAEISGSATSSGATSISAPAPTVDSNNALIAETLTSLLQVAKKLDEKLDKPPEASCPSTGLINRNMITHDQALPGHSREQRAPQQTATGSSSMDDIQAHNNEQVTALTLQESIRLQAQVNERLKDLLDSSSDEEDGSPKTKRAKGKKKSGLLQTATNKVKVELKCWPHMGIYTGPTREPAQYSKLTQAQFTKGYISRLQECKDSKVRELMLDHLVELMQDIDDLGFESARSFHGMILVEMEQDRLKWTDTALIQKLRTQFYLSYKVGKTVKDANKNTAVEPCTDWNSGLCLKFDSEHVKEHICSYCYNSKSRKCNHRAANCRQKSKN